MTGLTRGRAVAVLAASIVVAPTIAALPVSARTFEIAPHGALILNPLPGQFACALRRALAGRNVNCPRIHVSHRGVQPRRTVAPQRGVWTQSLGEASPEMSPAAPGATRGSGAMAQSPLASDIAAGRLATTRYQHNLSAAKAAGYRIITRMIPDMGYHFMNANVTGFDIRKPPILVYEHRGHSWQLGAFEWVFTSKPTTPPLPGARYGTFGAACHYMDGTLVYQGDSNKCAQKSPRTGAAFTFWHPRLITLHLWLWYPNPAGVFNGMNPLVAPFNRG